MLLFFDTETTGLSRKSDHVVQVAWILANEDGDIEAEECHVIRPDGYAIPWEAANIHGITTAIAQDIGKPLKSVLKQLSVAANKSAVVIAHNLSFDLGILQADYDNANLPFPFNGKTQVCTMKLSTTWCRLPKLNGSPGFKWPKLEELHYRLFGKAFDGAHDAQADTRACMRCYFELVDRGVISSPPLSRSAGTDPIAEAEKEKWYDQVMLEKIKKQAIAEKARLATLEEREQHLVRQENDIAAQYDKRLRAMSDPGGFLVWWACCAVAVAMIYSGIKPRVTDSAALVVGAFFGFIVTFVGRTWFENRKKTLPEYRTLEAEKSRSLAAVRGRVTTHPQFPTALPQNRSQPAQVPKPSSPLGYAGCWKCNRLLQPMESGLCADCRKPELHSAAFDEGVAPGIAEHVAKSNTANLRRIRVEAAPPSDPCVAATSVLLEIHNDLPPAQTAALEPRTNALALTVPSDADVATLEALSQSIYPAVRQAVACNENCPQSLLVSLRQDDHPEVRFAAALNGSISPSELTVFSQDVWPDTRRFVAGHALTPVRILEVLSGDADKDVRLRVAHHKRVARTALDCLARDGDSQIRLAVAKHTNVSDEALQSLRDDSDFEVRLVLARRVHEAKDELEKLANSHSWQHRMEAASNPLCPAYLLEKLAADPEPEVGKVAKKRIARAPSRN